MIKKSNIYVLVLIAAVFAMLCSCALLHNDKVVAKVNDKKLYASQVVKFIPPGTPEADSLELARQYINSWAANLIILEMADKKLPERERNIAKEVEDYKNSLLRYRYEQHYIAENLDTTVTWDEIDTFYQTNRDLYRLERPILKGHYAKFPVSSPIRDEIVDLLSSDADEDMMKLDSLSKTVVTRFTTFGGGWLDIVTLAKEYNVDYGILAAQKKGSIIEIDDENGFANITYISEYVPAGQICPLDYCSDRVRKAIVNSRKYILFSNLESTLLENAKHSGKLVIYE